MKKLLLALLVAALAAVALYFSLTELRQEHAAPELPDSRGPAEPALGQSDPAAKVVTPANPLPSEPVAPEKLVALEGVRAAADQQPGAVLPADQRCMLAVRIALPAGAPADDDAELWVTEAHASLNDLKEKVARLATGDALPKALLTRVPVEASGVTEIALARSDEPIQVVWHARYSYAKPAGAVAVSTERTEVALEPVLGACVRGQLIAPAGATEAQKDFSETEARLRSDPMAGAGRGGGFDVSAMIAEGTKCRADGSFELRGVPPVKQLTLTGRPDRLAAFKQELPDLTPGKLLSLSIPLSFGASASGRVVDDGGTAVAGAEISVRTDAIMFGFGGRELRETKSGADGSYLLEAVAAGKVMIDVEAAGYLDTTRNLELVEGERTNDLELRLERGADIAGRVTWSDGSGAAGAEVDVTFDQAHLMGMEAFNAARGATGKATSDDQGHFRVVGLGKGPFSIAASARPRGADKDSKESDWTAQLDGVKPGTLDVALILGPASALSGRVVDDTGAPIAKCTVVVGTKSRNPWIPAAESREVQLEDATGAFQVDALKPGEYTLRAEGELSSSQPFNVQVPRAEQEGEILLTLPRPATVSGRVLLPGGAPAAGAKVQEQVGIAEMQAGRLPGSEGAMLTEADGSFTIRSLPMGALVLHATHPDFAPSDGMPLTLAPAQQIADVTLVLRVGGTVTGEVYASDGSPKAGARILAQMPDLKYGQVWALSDSSGKFEIVHLAPGTWQVMSMPFEDMGKAGSGEDDESAAMSQLFDQLKIAMAEVKDGESVHVVLGAPPKDPVHVRGRVFTGKDPVSGAMVSFFDSSGDEASGGLGSLKMRSSDKDGRFEVDLDHAGSYLVSVQKMGIQGSQQSIEFSRVVPEGPECSLELELPVGSISGRVSGSDGEPLAGARVSLNVEGPVRAGTLTGGRFSEVRTDEKGEYLLEWLSPGQYSVSAGGALFGGMGSESNPPARQVRDGIEVGAGSQVRGVDFRLSGGCELTGKVVDAAGKPVAEAGIFLRDDQGRPVDHISMTATDAGGKFRQHGLGAGRYTVSARSSSLVSVGENSVLVREEEPASIELRMEAGTILLVTVSGADGKAIEASFSVVDDKGRQVNGLYSMADLMRVFTEGGFNSKEQRVGPLAPGKYKITAIGPDGKKTTKPVTLSGQTERKVNLELD